MQQSKTSKISAGVFLVILLAGAYLLANSDASNEVDPNNVNLSTALARYGFYLEDVTETWGINFNHQRPQLDSKLEHIMPQVASVGASVSVADFNNDGLQDFYVTNSANDTKNALYQNKGNGTFSNVADEMGVANLNTAETGASMSSVWGDYDNDGYEDLFLVKWGQPALFHNDGGKGFTDVTAKASLPEWLNANTAVWLDYDRDGLLDLFIGGYYKESIDLWNLESTKMMPESFEYSTNGGRNYLFHNLGNGEFEEVAAKMGLTSTRWTFAASAADLNGSGYPDLVIANDYGIDELYLNQEGKEFVSAGEKSGMGFAPKSGMNVTFGDVMNRGRLAIYVTNISEPGKLIQGNNLWMPTSEDGKDLSFQNLAGNFNIELGGWSYGAQFGDLNLDGYLDLYVANGYVSAEKGTDYWYSFSKVAGGNRTIISDAKNWPPMKNQSLSGYQENKIWLNDGAGQFREVASAVGGSLNNDSRAVAFADLNNDGTLEILVATQNGPLKIYRNTVKESNNWIGFKLNGIKSNSSAIGAEVELTWGANHQVNLVNSASGFSAQNQRPVYFGLGDHSTVQKAVIRWPSGITQTIESPTINQLHTVVEAK